MIKLIKRLGTQTIVVWRTPVRDGFGEITYAAPVEIEGRWQDKTSLAINSRMEEQISNAEIYTTEDLNEDEWVYLGELTDLSTAEKANPKIVSKAYKIKQTEPSYNFNGERVFVKVKL